MRKFLPFFLLVLGMVTTTQVQAEKPAGCPCCIPRMPIFTTSVIMEVYDNDDQFLGVLLFNQSFNPSKRLSSGRVQFGEGLEEAAQRVASENGPFTLSEIDQFHVYSNFFNGCFHPITLVHVAKVALTDEIKAGFSSFIYPLDEIPFDDLSTLDVEILKDYVEVRTDVMEDVIDLLLPDSPEDLLEPTDESKV